MKHKLKEPRYSAPVVCIMCGVSCKRTSNKQKRCVECSKIHAKQRNKAYKKRYYAEKKDKILSKNKKWKELNPEKVKKYRTDPKHLARQREYKSENYERCKEKWREYYTREKEKDVPYWMRPELKETRAHQASLRRAIIRSAMIESSDVELIEAIYIKCNHKNKRCKKSYHVDHIIPISIGGAHHQDNLRIITAFENQSKSAKYRPSLGGVWADNGLARETKRTLKLAA